MSFKLRLDKAKEIGKNAEKALDTIIGSSTALRNSQKLSKTLSLISAIENPPFNFESLHANSFFSECTFRTAKASCLELIAPLESCRRELDIIQLDVDDVSKSLRDTRIALDDIIRRVNGQLGHLRRAQGLAQLPDEILSLIFKNVYAVFPHVLDRKAIPFCLASVCRRFREVACATPQIWNYIYFSGASPELLECLLLRSRNTELEVDFDLAGSYNKADQECFDKLFTLVGAHCNRWGSLCLNSSMALSRKFVDTLTQFLSSPRTFQSLPRLHSINIDLTEAENLFRVLDEHAPNLRAIATNAEFGPDEFDVKLPKSVTELNIHDCSRGICDIDVPQFVAMLQSAELQELDLYFESDNDFSCHYGPQEGPGEVMKIRFVVNSISRFSIDLVALGFAEDLFDSLYFPNLESVELKIHEFHRHIDCGEEENEEDRTAIGISERWFAGRKFPKLKSISLKMVLDYDFCLVNDVFFESNHILKIAESCPALESLELDCMHLTRSVLLPPLRWLILSVTLMDDWLQNYGKYLKKTGNLHKFKGLVLKGCQLSEGDAWIKNNELLRRLTPDFGDKVVMNRTVDVENLKPLGT
ncbi:hypothetical protein SCHPADRAFT_1001355 [Schizopora paradoxa]|uniref:F-box domain-containing protein n=1 Tax=Schizopora paradoxa TaxID=27342 RepID=A0A0H2R7L0_9AGAM|nr:hypothetical protein SCHPADRAFT_1001355 [Schizopora paradoxa]